MVCIPMDSNIDGSLTDCKDCRTCKHFMPLGTRGRVACMKAQNSYMTLLVEEGNKLYEMNIRTNKL